MKSISTTLVALLLFVGSAVAQPVADGQFLTNFDGSVLEVTIQLQGSPAVKLAQSTLQFSFNEAGLSFPALPVKNVDYIYHNYDGFQGGALYSSNVTRIAGGVSLNIDYTAGGEDTGIDLSASWTFVATLYFDILDELETSNLSWTLVELFQIPGVPADEYAYGTFADLDISLDPGLPIEVQSFEAAIDGADVVLNWTAASGLSESGFEVQTRANDVMDWRTVGTVNTQGGNDSYSFRSEGLTVGQHRFRLAQLGAAGSVAYSNEIEVTVGLDTPFQIGSVFPNPFVDRASFELTVATQQHVTVEVYNLLGQRMETVFSDEIGANEPAIVEIDGRSIPSGTYLVRAQGANFVATRTVSLVK